MSPEDLRKRSPAAPLLCAACGEKIPEREPYFVLRNLDGGAARGAGERLMPETHNGKGRHETQG